MNFKKGIYRIGGDPLNSKGNPEMDFWSKVHLLLSYVEQLLTTCAQTSKKMAVMVWAEKMKMNP